jgi:hypothetical protein
MRLTQWQDKDCKLINYLKAESYGAEAYSALVGCACTATTFIFACASSCLKGLGCLSHSSKCSLFRSRFRLLQPAKSCQLLYCLNSANAVDAVLHIVDLHLISGKMGYASRKKLRTCKYCLIVHTNESVLKINRSYELNLPKHTTA